MMGQQVCRVGDVGVGVCFGHPVPTPFVTIFVSGDGVVDVDGNQMMRIGDIGICSCGHVSIAVSGSAIVEGSNGMMAHRVGDVGITNGPGTYVAVTGSSITDAE
jgi:hypothetical protein